MNIQATSDWRDQQIMRLRHDPTFVRANHEHRLMTLAADVRLDELPLKFRGSMVGAASAIVSIKDKITQIKDTATALYNSSETDYDAENATSIIKWCDDILGYISLPNEI